MSENMGAISYNVSVDTKEALKAEAVIDSSISDIVKQFDKADTAVREFEKSQKDLGNTINKLGQVFDKQGNVLSENSLAYRKLVSEANSLHSASMKQTKVSEGVQRGMKGAQQAAQNFSYQIQDIAVQLAGGQNPFLIIAQQLPQMLVGLGAAAAGIGALIAITGGLAMAMFDTSTSIEKMEKALEKVKAVITLSKDGIASYTDDMKRLAKVSEDLVKAKIALIMAEQNEAIKQGGKALKDYAQDATGFVNVFSSFDNVVKNLTGKKLGQEGFDEARSSLIALKTEITAFTFKPTTDGADELAKAINRFKNAGGDATAQGRQLIEMTINQVQLYREGKITLDQLNASLSKNASIVNHDAEAVRSLVEATKAQAETLGATDRALALHAAFKKGATQADYDAINAAYDKIEAYEKETEATKANEKAVKDRAAAIERASNALDAMFASEAREDEARAKREADARNKTAVSATGIADRSDPLGALQRQKEEELAIIAAAEQQGVDLHRSYADVRASIDEEYNAKIASAMEAQFIAQSEGNAFLMESLDALNQSATTTISGLLSGTMSATEAMQNFANIILNQAVGALVDVGIQYVKNALIKSAMDKSMMASEMATKATAAAMHTAAVGATVAELSSLAAAGAFAATAAIPIVGPALAPAAALGAASSAAALGAPAIAAAPIAGGRQFGGGVSANSMYRVGEAGPEIFQSNTGKNFMIPGQNGKVLSNSDSMGAMGGGNVNVVINNAPAGTTANVSQQNNGKERTIIVDLAVKEVARQISENQGVVPKALKSSTNTTMKASR